MIEKNILQQHHREYAAKPDEYVEEMGITKKSIVDYVLDFYDYEPLNAPQKIAVLGASDPRYLGIHNKIFNQALGPVDVTTLELVPDNLAKGDGTVIGHDVTDKFPDAYDVIFSHELMKFLIPAEQIKAIKNSYDALEDGGIAFHVIHDPPILKTEEFKEWQNTVNPQYLSDSLNTDGYFNDLLNFNSESKIDYMQNTHVLVLQKPLS